MSFGDIIWFIIISFCLMAYLLVLFRIIGDLFRDHEVGGLAKALWMIALIVVPFLSAFVYLIARGGGMAAREQALMQTAREQQDAYIKQVAASSTPTEQITQAKTLLDSGSISQAEFDALKAKALS